MPDGEICAPCPGRAVIFKKSAWELDVVHSEVVRLEPLSKSSGAEPDTEKPRGNRHSSHERMLLDPYLTPSAVFGVFACNE
jgi:hypothetical protein